MRVRTLLLIGIALAAVLVVTRLVYLQESIREHAELDAASVNARLVARNAAGLLGLAHDQLAQGSPRAARQWRASHAEIVRNLGSGAAHHPQLRAEFDQLRRVANGLPALFDAVLAASVQEPPDPVRRELLADHLLTETSRISEDAFALIDSVQVRRNAREATDARVTRFTMASLALLLLLIALVVSLRVLRPIARLEAAADAIHAGDADARSGYRASDEFGNLSARFDAMAQALQERSARLADSERFLRQVTDGLPMRIAYVDATGRYRFVNAAHCARFGLERAQIIGRTRAELKGGEPGDAERRLAEALAGNAQRYEFDELIDGEARCLESRMVPDRDAQGRIVGVFTSGIDITERKRAELELVATSSLLRTVLDSASEVGIIATDARGLITVFNIGAERLLGWRAHELVGQKTPFSLHLREELEVRARELSAELGRPVRSEQVLAEPGTLGKAREWTFKRSDGGRVTLSLIVTAMRGADGTILGYLGISHDVSVQKQAEEALHEAMRKARHASRAKSQFLANMSHEIRTPMNAVIGLTYLLAQTTLDEQQAGFLAKIGTASRSLLALINDVLDLSKIEAGELTIEAAPFALRHLLRDVSEVAVVQADAKGLAFRVEVADGLPEMLVGDPMRMNQVLLNLLCNAIKFTERGQVQLAVRAVQTGADRVRLRFGVRDSGIGIAPDVQARLFKPFAQADASMTRRFGGTGLGLSIVRTLVELMGGQVTLRSEAGAGSEFMVEIDFALAPADTMPAALAATEATDGPGLVGLRVLVADDSEINLDVAKRILALQGAQVETAANGSIACEMLRARPGGYDIVLMDVQMPVLDGYGATRLVRRELGLADLPIVALTAGALTSERQLATEAGMNAFITKPFDPRNLVRTIRAQLRAEARLRVRQAGTGPHAAVSAVSWPAIEGIDIADAHDRLGGDLPLFRSMLERLLGEFADPVASAVGQTLAVQAGCMHKLRGGAGMLGARTIQRLAADAEAACRADDPARAQRLAARLGVQLRRLRAAAQPLFDAAAAETRGAATEPAAALDPQAIDALCELLREHSLAAIERFAGAAGGLRAMLGEADFEALRRHVDDLRFDAALEILQTLERTRGSAVAA